LKTREESVFDVMDSVFTSIHRSVVLLDLVDDAWAADCLSDDGAGTRRAPFSLLFSLQHCVLLPANRRSRVFEMHALLLSPRSSSSSPALLRLPHFLRNF